MYVRYGWKLIDFIHWKSNLYSEDHTERTISGESDSTAVPEQTVQTVQIKLENLSEAVLDTVFIAASPNCVLYHIPLYSDGIYPDGFQEKQHHQATVVC